MNGGNGAPADRKSTIMEHSKLQFIIRGFSQVVGLRVFAFEGIAADHTRALFTVSADLSLTRRYGIRLQELPLLCRAVLEQCHDGGEKRAFAYTEAEMRLHAGAAAAREQAARQRKSQRRPAAGHAAAT